jgi:DNA-binding transcriptional ArsR family regulator
MMPHDPRTQRLLACLGDPSRFRVAATLLLGEYCVTDLAAKIGLSQSCTTRHLQVLRREGVVCGVRHGKRVIFRLCLDEPRVTALVRWALSAVAADGSPLALAGADLHHERESGRPGVAEARVRGGNRDETRHPGRRRAVSRRPSPETSSRRARIQPPADRGASDEASPTEAVSPPPGQAPPPVNRDELEDYLL